MLASSLLSVLGAAGWWWVTWPERTVEQFQALVELGKLDEAQAIVLFGPNWRFIPFPDEPIDDQRNEQLRSIAPLLAVRRHRTLADLVLGRQRFREPDRPIRKFGGAQLIPMNSPVIFVERGRISCVNNWVDL